MIMTLSEMQNKRSKASCKGDMVQFWLFDAMICLHLGLPHIAMDSLKAATKATQKETL
jgi:hypothetical protein